MVFRSPLEVWGGLECTVARIGGEVVDQTRLSGHEQRVADIDRFAALGITAIRYPVIWERVAPDGLARADWRWTDERLARLRDRGVRPIAALLHHGNGPAGVDLAAGDFVPRFVEFAARVAERYPWLDAYTPINEPLTTARFCGLYGLWHPHARDHTTFIRILINQIDGIRLAMRAIREVNPQAQLIQTEDLGKAHSTPRLAYQAEHENQRRWLTLDLLTGRVGPGHPLWPYLARAGVQAALEALRAEPCPPDVVGIDHYLTSERFLDDRLERYPAGTHTSNGRDRYADVEAVRAIEEVAGFEALALEAWERYRLPLAATEAHLGCTREQQLRWLKEIWDGARRLRARGVDVRAVTAWALLGSYDWNTLLTRRTGCYEPGIFDVRAPEPRATALARLVQGLASEGDADHPALDGPGWWRRADRLAWPPVRTQPGGDVQRLRPRAKASRPPRMLLITGGGGALASALARLCEARGLPHASLSRRELDISDPAAVTAAIERRRPWAVINAAGWADADRAQADPAGCRRANAEGPATLARACARAGIALVTCSSHLVFDGAKCEPYLEGDAPRPLGAYGEAMAAGEQAVLTAHPQALVVRAGPFFGPTAARGIVADALARAGASGSLEAGEVTVSPTYLPHFGHALLDLLIDGENGLWHLANQGAVTLADFGAAIVPAATLAADRARVTPGAAAGWVTPWPAYSVLSSRRGLLMPSLERAIAECLEAGVAHALVWHPAA